MSRTPTLPACEPGRCNLIGRRVQFPWGVTGYMFGCKTCHYTTATVDRHG